MLSAQHQDRLREYFQQMIVAHTQPMAQLPRWRHPLIGYFVGLFLVGLGLGLGLVETQLLVPFSFPGVLLLFAVVLVAFLWGVVPAVFTILLSLLVLDYLYVPPFGTIGVYGWSGMLQLFTFASAGIIVAVLTNQREAARLRAQTNELALREANRRMEEFLSIICHELKTPLTIVSGSLQLAERKVKRLISTEVVCPDDMRQFAPVQTLLERVKSQIVVMDRLVDDLLDASRIQAQTLKLLVRPCNLATIVQEAVEDQRQCTPARAIHLELPSDREVSVLADADRIVQVVTNYLTNALKYSPFDRPVKVRLRMEGQTAQVLVQDEGSGLPPTEHERVWERFYRVPGIEVQSGSGVGLGVGLHICQTIIERHGGSVGMQSCLGEGSTFWFTLPLAEPDGRNE